VGNTYLVWIGSEHYESIDAWAEEAKSAGVSKRLPNEHMAKALMEPGTIVFVAHDEGEHEECPECIREIVCPVCRRAAEKEARELAACEHLEGEAEKLAEGSKERASLAKRASNARERAEQAAEEQAQCDDCAGTGKLRAGSGGHVLFEDGDTWDYRQYNYWLHQPKKWTAEEKGGIAEVAMCDHCGGKGELPKGLVFGLFVPERFEYIKAEGDEEKAEALVAAGFEVVGPDMLAAEKKRKCGVRKPGGVYAVTSASGKSKAGKAAAKTLGLDASEIEVHGNFVRFLRPVAIPGVKRCRGLARFVLPDAVAEEAEMIADAAG
jgi:hypothetical protein